MDKRTIARRYAIALFNLLEEPTEQDAVREALHLLNGVVAETPSLKHILASPVFTLEDKAAVISALLARIQAPAILRAFFAQVIKKGRMRLLPDIADAFDALMDHARGIQPVMVISAQPLSANDQEDFQNRLETAIRKRVTLSSTSDPALIAGLRIRIGSRVYDNTLQGRLMTLRSLLAKG